MSQFSHYLLPTETWCEIFQFIWLRDLGESISLVNFYFYSIAFPIMHHNKPRKICLLHIKAIEGEEESCEEYIISSICPKERKSCFDFNMKPPENIIRISSFDIESVNAGVVNFLKYLCQYQLIHEVVVLWEEQTLDALARLWPESFSGKFLRKIVIQNRLRVDYDKLKCYECAMPRKIYSHPALLNFPGKLMALIGNKRKYHVGPLVHWLHWRAMGKWHPKRRLQITVMGELSEMFLNKFVSAILERFLNAKKICPFRVQFLTFHQEWPDLLEQPERINLKTGESLHFSRDQEKCGGMIKYEIRRA